MTFTKYYDIYRYKQLISWEENQKQQKKKRVR
jgi:hypothetical protein